MARQSDATGRSLSGKEKKDIKDKARSQAAERRNERDRTDPTRRDPKQKAPAKSVPKDLLGTIKDLFARSKEPATTKQLADYEKNLGKIRNKDAARRKATEDLLRDVPANVRSLVTRGGFYRDQDIQLAGRRGVVGSLVNPFGALAGGAMAIGKTIFKGDTYFEKAGEELGAPAEDVKEAIRIDRELRGITNKTDKSKQGRRGEDRDGNETDYLLPLMLAGAGAGGYALGGNSGGAGDSADLLGDIYTQFNATRSPISFMLGDQTVSFTPRANRDELQMLMNYQLGSDKLELEEPSTVDKITQGIGVATDLLGLYKSF